MISLNVLEPDVKSCRIYTPALFLWLSRIIINRVFDLSTMDCVSIKNSIKFIECYVIICLHGCSHTINVFSRAISLYRCQLDIQWLFIGQFIVVVLVVAELFCIRNISELCVADQYLFHLYQSQVRLFFSFVQDSPYFGAICFCELPPLLTLFLPSLLFLFLYLKVDFFENRILSSWIWIVRAWILTYFSDLCPTFLFRLMIRIYDDVVHEVIYINVCAVIVCVLILSDFKC